MFSFVVQPLFADIGGLIGIIIWLLIMVFSAIGKAKGKPKLGGGGGGPMQQPRPQAKAGGQKGIEAEIEDFLRQARGQQAQKEAPVQAAPARQAPPQPPRQPQQRPAARQQQNRPARPGRQGARVVEAQPAQPAQQRDIKPGRGFGRDLSQHVQEHIGQDSISTRDAHLGETIEEADERVERHLEEVFDHDLGRLEHVEEVDTSIDEGTDAMEIVEAADPLATAKRIRKMLGSADSVREVFIAAEILKRPDFD